MTGLPLQRDASSLLVPAHARLAGLAGPPPPGHLDVGLVGDLLLTDDLLLRAGEQGPGDLGESLWRPLAGCTLIIANLEAPVTPCDVPAENKAHNLKTSPRALEVFDARFVLSLANNHTMDFGPEGLYDTLAALDAAGVAHAGAGRDLDQARMPRYLSAGGVEAAVICAADPRFQPATASSAGTCPAIRGLLVEAVADARRRARFIAVSIHMGLEHVSMPSVTQIRLAEACLAAGAQLVQFHHSHCLSGSASDGRGLVLFGTGNYVFPGLPPFSVRQAKRTAVWRIRYATEEDAVIAASVEPALIDRSGIPHAVTGRDRECRRRRIRKCSDRMLQPVRRQLWLLRDMLHPAFVMVNLWNYVSMARRRGPRYVWRSLLAGLKVHLAR